MKRALLLGALALACGGSVEAEPPVTDDAVEEQPAPVMERPAIPLCAGSPEEAPDLCQQLRYGDHGYCNFWRPCND